MFLHAKHAAGQGYNDTAIHSSDTDVLVLAMFYQDQIQSRILVISGAKVLQNVMGIRFYLVIGRFISVRHCQACTLLQGVTVQVLFVEREKLQLLKMDVELCNTMQKVGESFDIAPDLYSE